MTTARHATDAETITWKPYLIETCAWSSISPDPSTQNAGMLVNLHPDGSITSYRETLSVNEFPRGVKYLPERWERPAKYQIIEHAERNAIYSAARIGLEAEGLTLVCPWAACSDCARGIIQSGIVRLVTLAPQDGDTPDRWQTSVNIAMKMLEEAQVEVLYVKPLGASFTIRRDGKPFTP